MSARSSRQRRPDQIARYRAEHPGVSFSVRVRGRAAAEEDLSTFSSDLALVFEPVDLADCDVTKAIPQPIAAVMSVAHPLARRPNLRLRDCLEVPHRAPARDYGVRRLLDFAARGRSRQLAPTIEADSFEMMREYVLHEQRMSFQIPIGLTPLRDPRLAVRLIDARNLPAGLLPLGQMRGRALPAPTAKFALQLAAALEAIEAG